MAHFSLTERAPLGNARTPFSCSNIGLFSLKSCTPMKGAPWSTAWATLRAQRLKKFEIALRDCNFQARLKNSSEPPACTPVKATPWSTAWIDLGSTSAEGILREIFFELRNVSRKRGVEFNGGSLHDGFGGFDGFGGSEEHPALLLSGTL